MPSFPVLIDFQNKRKTSVFKGSETIGGLTPSLHLDALAGSLWAEGPFITGSGRASPSLGRQTG